MTCTVSGLRSELQQIPQIAIQVLEDCDGTVWSLLRLPNKDDALGLVRAEIAPEVIGM
jgi:hypothetical protein